MIFKIPSALTSSNFFVSVKNKFQCLREWTQEHKKEMATAILILGIAAVFFSVGAVYGLIIPTLMKGSVLNFIYSLFSFDSGSIAITGLSKIGTLFFTSIGFLYGGTALYCFVKGLRSEPSE
jgi:hypothetical protein